MRKSGKWQAGERSRKRHSVVGKWVRRVSLVLFALLTLFTAVSYAVGVWYQRSHYDIPKQLGVTFIPAYTETLGIDAEQTLTAVLDDLGVKHLRLVSYWEEIEAERGTYDFSNLDWQMDMAADRGASVSLAIGLRQPRWPECHAPGWVDLKQPRGAWQPALERFIAAVVERYRTHPALQSYQLENEYFLKGFGICPDDSRERLVSEYELVKKFDRTHPVIVSRSNNAHGVPWGEPRPDVSAISIYRRTWDHRYLKNYITYPFTSWYYSALLGWTQLLTDRDSIIHELQCEPWTPRGQTIPETSLAEQNKSFDAKRFRDTVEFARQIGSPQTYLWGVEYWYYRDQVLDDNSVWQTAQRIFAESEGAAD